LYVWIGLEINLLSFIPILIISNIDSETERRLKYFLIQSLGSGILLIGCLVHLNFPNSLISHNIGIYILVFRLIIKVGIAPFHFWLPHVIGGIRWINCIFLSVWQKIGPIFILSRFFFNNTFFLFICAINAVVGGVGGLNQTQIRVLLAYSSIGHIGWILVSIIFSYNVFFIYFVVYSLINLRIILFINFFSLKGVNISTVIGFSSVYNFFIILMFLSLAGLPPFLGFYPKWIVLYNIIENNIYLLSLTIIGGTLINIYYYLAIFFNMFIKSFFFNFIDYNILNINKYLECLLLLTFVIRRFCLGLFYFI